MAAVAPTDGVRRDIPDPWLHNARTSTQPLGCGTHLSECATLQSIFNLLQCLKWIKVVPGRHNPSSCPSSLLFPGSPPPLVDPDSQLGASLPSVLLYSLLPFPLPCLLLYSPLLSPLPSPFPCPFLSPLRSRPLKNS